LAEEIHADVIERARTDRFAFGELYDFYLPHVHAFCRAHTSSREDAEDMTAQTFERALAAIGRYELRGVPFSAWLLRIAANCLTDLYRRRGRARVDSLGDNPIPEPERGSPTPHSPAQMVERWEEAGRLLAHVVTLPPDQQEAVTLRYWQDRSVRDVAQRMDRSEAAVRQLIHRAIKGLRLRLDREATADA
jgi:RNA polymerase sigma-70 factor (ECF subfamily)